jgi:transposase-like protein
VLRWKEAGDRSDLRYSPIRKTRRATATAPYGQPIAREMKRIYNAETAEVAAKRLEEFANSEWGKKLPPIVQSWRRVWEEVIPFFAYPLEIRKIIYTTNAIESLHMQLPKVLKNQGHFPSDEAMLRNANRIPMGTIG